MKGHICVFCKNCNKPFSVGVAKCMAIDPDWARKNKKYHDQGFKIDLVEEFDGVWCDCPKGEKDKKKVATAQLELFA